MALYTSHFDAPAVVAAAREWVNRGLVSDRSVFSDEAIATSENFEALETYFVQQPDVGSGDFYEKLEAQLSSAPPGARKLMAELLWGLFLFPSNIPEERKREGVLRTWGFSGDALDPAHPMLRSEVLGGIGSGGRGVYLNRWRELNYLIAVGQSLKALAQMDRQRVLTDYDAFMDWIVNVTMQGDRQVRHMFRYLLFPDRVERMSSNVDRKHVLEAFKVASSKEMRHWSDRQLDDAMLALRQEQEKHFGTDELDFYLDPLRARWKSSNEPDTTEEADATANDEKTVVVPASAKRKPRNIIYYGPPGTGKTWRLQQLFEKYTEQVTDLDRDAWLQQLVAPFGWREVIAATLADLGEKGTLDEIERHPLLMAKAIQRQRTRNVRKTLWAQMQIHTRQDSQTVNVAERREPFVFDKEIDSSWVLVEGWRDADMEAAELFDHWSGGQREKEPDVKRYRVVTFHPSYTYEDFVIGLRPVTTGGDQAGMTSFRMVSGVFKQLCTEARANPTKHFALFIDEINRANIAKVFGELITLIEPDKRARYDASGNCVAGMEVQLPGTSDEEGEIERFGVPENVDIIGTMNTADRSIALLDIALRRRFEFEEVAPNYSAIPHKVSGIDLAAMLRQINDRVEYLADRDRLIGHGYFTSVSTLDELRAVFRDRLIPLLQEYFFDDLGRVAIVLSANHGECPFLERQALTPEALFSPKVDVDGDERVRYRVRPSSEWTEEMFRSLYEPLVTSAG
jgi:5-methylcytosine-specific restriction protein B